MNREQVIERLTDELYTEATKSGAEMMFVGDPEILVEDEDCLSILVGLRPDDFGTDDGIVSPEPVHFELQYRPDEDESLMIVGEDHELDITYGNVMAFMYFSSIQAEG